MTAQTSSQFDGVPVGRPAIRGLHAAGYQRLAELPDDLDALLTLHGVGPKAVRLLAAARQRMASPEA